MLRELMEESNLRFQRQQKTLLDLTEAYTCELIALIEDITGTTFPAAGTIQTKPNRFAPDSYDYLQKNAPDLASAVQLMQKIRGAMSLIQKKMAPGPTRERHIARCFTALNKVNGMISGYKKSQNLTQDEEARSVAPQEFSSDDQDIDLGLDDMEGPEQDIDLGLDDFESEQPDEVTGSVEEPVVDLEKTDNTATVDMTKLEDLFKQLIDAVKGTDAEELQDDESVDALSGDELNNAPSDGTPTDPANTTTFAQATKQPATSDTSFADYLSNKYM